MYHRATDYTCQSQLKTEKLNSKLNFNKPILELEKNCIYLRNARIVLNFKKSINISNKVKRSQDTEKTVLTKAVS